MITIYVIIQAIILLCAIHVAFTLFVITFIREKKLKLNMNYKPTITVLIAAHNEATVIFDTVRSILNTGYKLNELIVIAHNCKDKTYEIAQRAGAMAIRCNEGNTKGHALNYGLKYATGEIVLVFDADNQVPKNFFVNSVPKLEHYDALQTKIQVLNKDKKFLPRMAHIEFSIHTVTKMIPFSNRGFAILGGNGQFIKRKVLDEVGAWSDSLVDDTEISFRIIKAGYRIGFCNESKCYQDGVEDLGAFLVQRSRWAYGNLTLLNKTFQFGIWKGINIFFAISGWILFYAAITINNFILIFNAFSGGITMNGVYWIAINFLIFLMVLVRCFIKEKIQLRHLFGYFAYMHLIYPIMIKVIKRGMKKKVSWNKTERTIKFDGDDKMRKNKILCIDDDKNSLFMLQQILKDEYEIRLENSSTNALYILNNGYFPDLILLDLMMPELDGYELLTLIKNNPILEKIPVIMLTANITHEGEIQGLKLGVADYIHKPFNFDILKQRIEKQISVTKSDNKLREVIEVLARDE